MLPPFQPFQPLKPAAGKPRGSTAVNLRPLETPKSQLTTKVAKNMNARHLQKYSLTAALLLLAGALNVQAVNVTKKNTTTMNGGLTD